MPDFSISPRSPFFVSVKKLILDKKLKIFLNYFVGPVLFVWLSYSIYQQIQRQADVHQSWQLIRSAFTGPQLWKIFLVAGLMILNWGIEAHKWQVLVSKVQRVSFGRAYRAILSGQALAFNTPNRAGESAGRAVYLEEGNRLRGIVLSVVGSMSQIIVTFVLGLLSLVYLRFYILVDAPQQLGLSTFWLDVMICAISAGLILFIVLYFNLSWATRLLERIPIINRHKFFVQKLEDFHSAELTKILFLSFCRYVVFVVQYVLLLQVFEVQVSFLDAATMVGVMFLVLAIVPTIALAELGFRGKVSLQLFGLFSTNTIGIVATAAGIWIINLIIPAIAGSLFILGIRLFRNK
ncbi:MAG: Lysylphosphatidylglycerol synthase region [Sediminibacterium sp.]|nr:Lysylphosphatidylglycerol synthase region [Sediminibacterium sp.]